MPEKLGHRETAVGNTLVKGPVRQGAFGGNEVHVGLAPQPLADDAKLRDLFSGNSQLALAGKVNAAGVLEVKFIQLWADFAPNASLLGGILDYRRPKTLQAATTAEFKQFRTPAKVFVVPETGVTNFQLQFRRIRWRHHAFRIERLSVFKKQGLVFHD